MTLVAMSKQNFDSLNDERLGWACMEPTFLQIRGKNESVKTEVITQLSKGQQALCMFRVLHDHAINSAGEYYAWVCYLLDKSGYWSGVMGSLSFFEDTSMIRLLEETKETLEIRNSELGVQWSDATIPDLDHDNELRRTVSVLFGRFLENARESHTRISVYIRSNPQEFVSLEG
ncbi:hypothetical protein [Cohnella abietis]|uniref:DUF4375 domain-containing protein n=1 Tax=Cohnella abietis TaxID=2507935 RepID=A0A3T1CYP0_9BACL|nr:hypothetical protein [Cohnella abietis]BBI30956.1 hypothetical protein KCTCHS21_03550 [Cohnella abietis]